MGAALGITAALVIAIVAWWFVHRRNSRLPMTSRGCRFCGSVIGHKYDCPLHNYRDGD